MRIFDSIKKQVIVFSALGVLLLICLNTAIVFYNNYVLQKTIRKRVETERATYLLGQVWNQVVRNVDVGMRGYALTKSEDLLGPLRDGIRDKTPILEELRSITASQGFSKPATIDSISMCVDQFINATLEMVELVKIDSMNLFREALAADPGRDAWLVYDKNAKIISAFENDVNSKATSDYERADKAKLIFQTILFIVAVPTLIFMIVRIRQDKKARKNLFAKLEENNRTYLFNPGSTTDDIQENEVIDNSIRNFKKATQFINNITSGNLDIQWEGISKDNEALNKQNLAGELSQMRDKMKEIKAADEIRNWTTEGLAKFSDVIRGNQQSIKALCYDVLAYVVKYLNAQQGGIFVLMEDVEGNSHLELSAAYAFSKKKFIEKRIQIGEGMIGQTFLEGQPIVLTKIPQGYTEITSGLGELTASCLMILPMKYNEKIEAVIEIAGFNKFEQHEISFVEKVGEITASTLSTVKNTEKMKFMVDQFKSQTEQLKAQEEELRQNMEEMEATQEAFRRQEKESLG